MTTDVRLYELVAEMFHHQSAAAEQMTAMAEQISETRQIASHTGKQIQDMAVKLFGIKERVSEMHQDLRAMRINGQMLHLQASENARALVNITSYLERIHERIGKMRPDVTPKKKRK